MRSYLKHFLIPLVFALIAVPSDVEAQIWKKIKNKTKQKVEERAAEKISEKIAEAVMGKMNEKLESESNPYKGNIGSKISKPKNLPEEYKFNWKYQIKMSSKSTNDEVLMNYMLPKEGSYIGYTMPDAENMFSVVDFKEGVMISYMEEDGNSFAISHDYPTVNYNEMEDIESNQDEGFEVTELPDKEFAGYLANGYRYENEQSIMIVYITEEAGVSFNGFGAMPGQGMPSTYGLQMGKEKDALMLYMKFTDKDNSDNEMEMECISLKKESLSKNNKEYSFL